MNRMSILAAAGDAAGALGDAIDLKNRVVARLARWRRRRRTRASLGHLNDRLLADIGLTRGDVLVSRFRAGRSD